MVFEGPLSQQQLISTSETSNNAVLYFNKCFPQDSDAVRNLLSPGTYLEHRRAFNTFANNHELKEDNVIGLFETILKDPNAPYYLKLIVLEYLEQNSSLVQGYCDISLNSNNLIPEDVIILADLMTNKNDDSGGYIYLVEFLRRYVIPKVLASNDVIEYLLSNLSGVFGSMKRTVHDNAILYISYNYIMIDGKQHISELSDLSIVFGFNEEQKNELLSFEENIGGVISQSNASFSRFELTNQAGVYYYPIVFSPDQFTNIQQDKSFIPYEMVRNGAEGLTNVKANPSMRTLYIQSLQTLLIEAQL